MRIKDTDLPPAAIDAGRTAMVTGFRAADVQGAVAATLRSLANAGAFDYGRHARDDFDMRVADRLIQNARQSGAIRFDKGRWTVLRPA